MKLNSSIILLIGMLILNIEASQPPLNVIYLSLEGVSRRTLYSLIQKSKLPGLQISIR